MSQQYKAVLRNVRVTPRKARLVVDLVRGKPVAYAIDLLTMTQRKSAPYLAKLIKSAIANATSQSTVDVDRLVVKEAFVDEGQTLKRYLPRAQGRATQVRKRSSHITVKLVEL